MSNKSIESSIVFGILDLGHQLSKENDRLGKDAGVTSQQWLILHMLDSNPNTTFGASQNGVPGLFASELADALKVSRPNITNLVTILVQKGLVIQIEDAVDRRKKKLILSEKGQTLIGKLDPIRRYADEKFLSCLSLEEKENFFKMIEKCLNNKR